MDSTEEGLVVFAQASDQWGTFAHDFFAQRGYETALLYDKDAVPHTIAFFGSPGRYPDGPACVSYEVNAEKAFATCGVVLPDWAQAADIKVAIDIHALHNAGSRERLERDLTLLLPRCMKKKKEPAKP